MSGHHPFAPIRWLATNLPALRERLRLAAAVGLTAACGGCAAFSPDGGMATVNGIVASTFNSDAVKVSAEDLAGEAHARAANLLGSTLSADAAVRIAFLNNKGLQAS